MQDPKYTQSTLQFYHTRYVREYRAICVLWGILTIIFCILNVVAFIQPQWIGDTHSSLGYGHVGLWQVCEPSADARGDYRYVCTGEFGDFSTILTDAFKAATFFVGVSALLMLFCVAGMLLFFCFKRRWVFLLCGTMQVISAIFMFLGCVIYPSGWGHPIITTLCSHEDRTETETGAYKLGECGIRWAYILAILGIIDAAVLGALALVLATKSVRKMEQKMDYYASNGVVSKSELNGYAGDTMSKRSMPIQPVVTVPDHDQGDRYSEYSHRSEKSKRSAAHNFQL